jgi:pimeloyl-ACP methyl ester carboxylesterase
MLFTLGQDFFSDRHLGDDTSTEFRRIDGDPRGTTICFLPWLMPYRLAMGMRVVPRDFLACYEMPRAVVSSEPDLCVEAVEAVTADAMRVVRQAGLDPDRALVVGLSIGNAVATVLANRLGARLCSIASADRGDLTLWESPASQQIRVRAEAKGYRLADFTRALRGLHTIDNLENLAPGSRFIVSLKDELIPEARRDGLVAAVRRTLPAADVSYVDSGHFGTMIETVRRGLYDPREMQLARA